MALVFLSVGSNLGDRLRLLTLAYQEVSERIGKVAAFSSVYETEPWGFTAEQYFLNQVLSVETNLEPVALIEALLKTENLMGRIRQKGDYQSRIIDIDILLYGLNVITNEYLQIPHPRMHLRKFVLSPLAEVAPDVVHPVFGITARQLLERCEDTALVNLLYNQQFFQSLLKE